MEELSLNNNLLNITLKPYSIKSSTSDDIYNIHIVLNKINQKLMFQCSCGIKFIGKYRTSCKHIKEIINNKINEEKVLDMSYDSVSELLSNLTF
jgi:hypothetical protein